MGHMKILNDTKLILNDKGVTQAHLGPIWYHSEPSDLPYLTNQFFGWDSFAASYIRIALHEFTYFLNFSLTGGYSIHATFCFIYKMNIWLIWKFRIQLQKDFDPVL